MALTRPNIFSKEIINQPPYILTYKSTARISRPPNFYPKMKKIIQDPCISRPPFQVLDGNLFCGTQRSVREIVQSTVRFTNQAANVCLWPSYCQITIPLFYRRYHRTAIWIMIKLVRPTARSSHVCRHPAWPPDDLPVSYYPAYAHGHVMQPIIKTLFTNWFSKFFAAKKISNKQAIIILKRFI